MTKNAKSVIYPVAESSNHSSKSYHSTPSTIKQFIDQDNPNYNKENKVLNANFKSSTDYLSSVNKHDTKSNDVIGDHIKPKYNNYHSSMPYLLENARLASYAENTFKPPFDTSQKDLATYRARIYWRCYFNAISCF